MSYVLDTTIVSALMRGERTVGTRLLEKQPSDVGIPQPVIAEIEYGLARLPASRKKRILGERLGVLMQAIPRLSWNDAVSARFGEIKATLERQGRRVDDFDLAIAAHAIGGAVLVTHNTRHFARVPGLTVEDWT